MIRPNAILVLALVLSAASMAAEPQPAPTIEESRQMLGLEPDENLDLPLHDLPLPGNGIWVYPEVARQWLVAARQYAITTAIPAAEAFNRGIKQRFARLIQPLITEPQPTRLDFTVDQIQNRLREIETFRQAGMNQRLGFIVHWAAYDGIGVQIIADPERWGALKDLYNAAAPFKDTKQL